MTRKITILDANGRTAFVLADDSLGRAPQAGKPTRLLISTMPGGDALVQQYNPFRGAELKTKAHTGQDNQSSVWRPQVAYGFTNGDELLRFQCELQENLPTTGTVELRSAGAVFYLPNASLRPFETVQEMDVLWVVQFTFTGGIITKSKPITED